MRDAEIDVDGDGSTARGYDALRVVDVSETAVRVPSHDARAVRSRERGRGVPSHRTMTAGSQRAALDAIDLAVPIIARLEHCARQGGPGSGPHRSVDGDGERSPFTHPRVVARPADAHPRAAPAAPPLARPGELSPTSTRRVSVPARPLHGLRGHVNALREASSSSRPACGRRDHRRHSDRSDRRALSRHRPAARRAPRRPCTHETVRSIPRRADRPGGASTAGPPSARARAGSRRRSGSRRSRRGRHRVVRRGGAGIVAALRFPSGDHGLSERKRVAAAGHFMKAAKHDPNHLMPHDNLARMAREAGTLPLPSPSGDGGAARGE